jgi:hypothetical protein
VNLCTSCGEDFGSVSAFDAHRVGSYEHLVSHQHPDGRRCLTADELRERGWKPDGRGRWRRPSDGAPWADSGDKVTTERRAKTRAKGLRLAPHGRPSTQLPDLEKARSAQ